MKLAIVGATGLVGQEVLKILEERNLDYSELIPVASARSVGKTVTCKGKEWKVVSMEDGLKTKPDVAIFSAGGSTSLEWAPKFAEAGTIVIDNSSAWRMDPEKRLVVPEINGKDLRIDDRIIANPNCSTIQMVLVLAPLHEKYRIKRVVVSTYQSVTGTGKEAVEQMTNERKGVDGPKVYPHAIDQNALPHIDIFYDNGYTKEEMKMVNETKKILNDDTVAVTATCVRIPAVGGHAEAVNIEFEEEFDLDELRGIIAQTEGVVIEDDPQNNVYPMPITAHGKDEVFVGRIRRDETQAKTVNLWIVADNLRKGAATNAVQIAEYMVERSLVY
ncbi:MAG: aspartate-semialdehyde dehydrogenase [Bacteroidota bacterium]